jgi:hypothetical protein
MELMNLGEPHKLKNIDLQEDEEKNYYHIYQKMVRIILIFTNFTNTVFQVSAMVNFKS